MRQILSTISKLALLGCATLAITNCNKGSSGGGDAAAPAASACGVGSVQNAQYGCLPTSNGYQNCATGFYQNQCIGQNGAQGSCSGQPGYVYTNMGCLPQGSCGVNQAQYGNTCVAAIQSNQNFGGYTQYPNLYGQQQQYTYQQQYYYYPQQQQYYDQGYYNNGYPRRGGGSISFSW